MKIFYCASHVVSNSTGYETPVVCEEKSWRPYAAARSDFQYVSHKPLW
jgi:hypothetical protein